MRVQIFVTTRPEIPDPQGNDLKKRAKDNHKIDLVSVRQGRFFEVEVVTSDPEEARAIAKKAAEALLANKISEEYTIVLPP